MNQEELNKILEKHKKWLKNEGGERANLYEANLREANLREADLRGADLYEANLREADLYGANLREANLRAANLHGANLYGANLRATCLHGANLYGANLYGAKGIIHIQCKKHDVWAQKNICKVGCHFNNYKGWQEFDASKERYTEKEEKAYKILIAACKEAFEVLDE